MNLQSQKFNKITFNMEGRSRVNLRLDELLGENNLGTQTNTIL